MRLDFAFLYTYIFLKSYEIIFFSISSSSSFSLMLHRKFASEVKSFLISFLIQGKLKIKMHSYVSKREKRFILEFTTFILKWWIFISLPSSPATFFFLYLVLNLTHLSHIHIAPSPPPYLISTVNFEPPLLPLFAWSLGHTTHSLSPVFCPNS